MFMSRAQLSWGQELCNIRALADWGKGAWLKFTLSGQWQHGWTADGMLLPLSSGLGHRGELHSGATDIAMSFTV